jgi:two-component system, sensor histidine kinase LadS
MLISLYSLLQSTPARPALACRRMCLFALLALVLCFASSSFAQNFASSPASLVKLPTTLATASSVAPSLSTPVALLSSEVRQLDLAPFTEYWIDESKNTSLAELKARADQGSAMFKPSKTTDAHRIHDKVLWLRFDLRNDEPQLRWLLELDSPLIDDVKLYWQAKNGQWMSLKAGDAVARKQWPMPTRLPTFSLPVNTNEVIRFYLRIENARVPVSLPLVIYSEPAYIESGRTEYTLLGALTGLIGLILLASIGMAIKRREPSFIACSVYLLALGLFNLTYAGLTPLYVWNESPMASDRMNYVLAAATAALGPWLARLIVHPIARANALRRLTVIQAFILLICAVVEAIHPTPASYAILNLGVLTSVILVYLIVAAAWQRGEDITRWVAISFVPVALSALPVILRNLGLIPNSFFTQSAVHIATCIELPILFYALLARSNLRRESMARAKGLPSKDALTGLPNLRSFLEQLHGSILRAERFKHSYGLILVELSNHAWFVKEHGRDMADRAVIIVSTRLQQLLRDVDGICRLDEANFAVLVEGACQAGQLTKIAARISARAHEPTDLLPVGASLRLSVCCALMPTAESLESGEHASDQLGWLIAAAEAIPAEQRKMVRSVGF